MTATKAQDGFDRSNIEVINDMAPGWNLGNTFEAVATWAGVDFLNNKGGLDAETAWQGTKTTQEIIDFVKSLGFRSVRIPCAWAYGHISNASTYEIDSQWMARVKEVVDYCINDGLYVVLNDHWDGGWLENHIKDSDAATIERNKEILTALWTQIANAFIDYASALCRTKRTQCRQSGCYQQPNHVQPNLRGCRPRHWRQQYQANIGGARSINQH